MPVIPMICEAADNARHAPRSDAATLPNSSLPAERTPPSSGPDVEFTVPVYNEERTLESNIRRLHSFLADHLPFTFEITVIDNASVDQTWVIAGQLEQQVPGVRALRLEEKGRGLALRSVWPTSRARVVAYMDVDLSTDLAAVLPLVGPLLSGHCDMAIGSRLTPSSHVKRGWKREAISRCYNLILRTALHVRFSDAQCGFKAMRTDVARELVPLVLDGSWFFDTELLVIAERAGLRIHEVPVDWVDDPDSRVKIVPTALADLRGVIRMRRALTAGTLPIDDLREHLSRRPPSDPVPAVPRESNESGPGRDRIGRRPYR